eukprot:CAMPEP_0173092580 /NCGR_PEP_ID=MMETSP1102-20130122/29153_1 /TAXON_ID=49646 /ORGANISM="Geminigera sp., Strain Caron Lab Isolate" /LENGTH=59 /DNA_ID=CAMNT_0013979779 /DNA_START=571 /DNA_END=746 /DNA_ORIENTATION=-
MRPLFKRVPGAPKKQILPVRVVGAFWRLRQVASRRRVRPAAALEGARSGGGRRDREGAA